MDLNSVNKIIRDTYGPQIRGTLIRGTSELILLKKDNAWLYVYSLNSWHNPSSDTTITDEEMPEELKTEWLIGDVRSVSNFMFPSKHPYFYDRHDDVTSD